MFEEDENGDLLLAPDHIRPNAKVVSGAAAANISVSTTPSTVVQVEPESVQELGQAKTLREMLYQQDSWALAGHLQSSLSPGIRRLQEKRVNRVLNIVADWMLTVVEQRIGDEMTLVVLLELAEIVRGQVVWPELEASDVVARGPEDGDKENR